jgi:hypothetical protein
VLLEACCLHSAYAEQYRAEPGMREGRPQTQGRAPAVEAIRVRLPLERQEGWRWRYLDQEE